jgi:hypothetical protein
MHSTILVLLPPGTRDIDAGLERLLVPHLWDEDDPDKVWRLDWWNPGDGSIGAPDFAAQLGIIDSAWAANVCPVDRLPANYLPRSLVDPGGVWYDLGEHGWGSATDTPQDQTALEAWSVIVRRVLSGHPDCLAVEVDAHS